MCGLIHGQFAHSSLSSSCNNYINIAGRTNLNQFRLYQDVADNFIFTEARHSKIRIDEYGILELRIPVLNFEASSKFVYRDFIELLDASKNTHIIIILKKNEVRKLSNQSHSDTIEIGVILNGISNYYKIPGQTKNCTDGSKFISGIKTLKLTDFKLEPPEKSFGLIKVENELIVNFEFRLPPDPELIYSGF